MMATTSMDLFLWTAAVALIIVGLLGILLPGLPGTVLIFAGLLLGAWVDDFAHVGAASLVVIGVLGAISYGVDFVAAALGVQKYGASRRAAVGAALGTVAGLFLGLPGLIVGPFAGAVLAELTLHRDVTRAGKVGLAAWIGFVVGMAVKVGLAFAMVGIFVMAFLY